VILIHGNGSDPGFWERQGFAPGLRTAGVPLNASIMLNEAGIEANGWELSQVLPDRVREFGAEHVHLVAHSKGGLDTREFLAKYGSPFEVVSLVTLSTPHRGVAGADFAVSRQHFSVVFGAGTEANFLSVLARMFGSSALDPTEGRRDLTVGHVGQFNADNVAKLPAGLIFQVVGADTNTDDDPAGDLDYVGDNLEAMVSESPDFTAFHQELGDAGVERVLSILYRFLRDKSVLVPAEDNLVNPLLPMFVSSSVMQGGGPNDILVPILSAEGPPGAPVEVLPHYLGSNGRNHSDVADDDSALTVLPYLLDADARDGGFSDE